MRPILIATTNKGKRQEVAALLADLPLKLESLQDYPDLPAPVENGETFLANATLKAVHYAKLAHCWALADDSGLCVDALQGEPGVHSARYSAGDAAPDDEANNAKLVQMLAAVPLDARAARFHCSVVLAAPDRVLGSASGEIAGIIVDQAEGDNGFGYDPHFFLPDRGVTMAQLSPQTKNSISHRGNALRAIRPIIEDCLRTTAAAK